MVKVPKNNVERLALRGEIAELARVPPWVDALAARYAFPEKSVFAIDLCLEEALSNIMRHGYAGIAEGSILIGFREDANELVFTLEDEAPHFRPSDAPTHTPESLEELTPGGLGILLMNRFANRVEWEPLLHGNRLTLAFARPS